MLENSEPLLDWQRVKTDLLAYRVAQHQMWGDVAEMTLAKFAAGTCNEAERAQVLAAMEKYPAVRQLVNLVGSPLLEAATAAPSTAVSPSVWSRQKGVATLSERLRSWVQDAGDVLAAGMADLLHLVEPPAAAGAIMGDDDGRSGPATCSRLPIDWIVADPATASNSIGVPNEPTIACESDLIVVVRPHEDGDAWDLTCSLARFRHMEQDAKLEIINADSDLEFAGTVAEVSAPPESPSAIVESSSPIVLDAGNYEIVITLATSQWRIPLTLGETE